MYVYVRGSLSVEKAHILQPPYLKKGSIERDIFQSDLDICYSLNILLL